MRRPPVIRIALVWGLVAACLIFAIARQIDANSRIDAALAGAAPLGLPAALVACGIAAWALRCQRSAWTWSATAGAAGAVLIHMWIFAPFVLGDQPARPTDATDVRVMTLNMDRGRADVANIEQIVSQRRPDILILNEITDPALARIRQTSIARSMRFVAGATGGGAEGTLVFSRTRLNEETIYTSVWSYLVDTRIRDADVRLLAVHPANPKVPERWIGDLDIIKDVSPTVDLVAGDLNATSDHRPFREILSNGNLRDAVELANAGWEPTFPTDRSPGFWGIGPPRLLQIDHILVRDDGGVDSVDTLKVAGTDHAAVIADVWFPAKSRDPRATR